MNWKRVCALALGLLLVRPGLASVAIQNVGSGNLYVSYQGGYTIRTISPGGVHVLEGYTGTIVQPGDCWRVNVFVNTTNAGPYANYLLPDNWNGSQAYGAMKTFYDYHKINADTWSISASWGVMTNQYVTANLGVVTNADNLYHQVTAEIWTNNLEFPSDTNLYLAYSSNYLVAPGGFVNWSFTNADYGTSGVALLKNDAGTVYRRTNLTVTVMTNTLPSWGQGYSEQRDLVQYLAQTQSVTFPGYTAGTRQTASTTAAAIFTSQEFNSQARFNEQMTQDRNMFNLNRMADNALLETVGSIGYQARQDAQNALSAAQAWGYAITNSVRDMSAAARAQATADAAAGVAAAEARMVAVTNYFTALGNQRALESFTASSNAAVQAGYNTTLITNAVGGVERAVLNTDFQLQYLTNLLTGQKELLTVGQSLSSNQWREANSGLSNNLGALREIATATSNHWQETIAARADYTAGNNALAAGLSNVVAAIKEGSTNSVDGATPGPVNTNAFAVPSNIITNMPLVGFDTAQAVQTMKGAIPFPVTVGQSPPALAIPLGSLGVVGLADTSLDFGIEPLSTIAMGLRAFVLFLMTCGFVWHVLRVVGMVAPR